MPAVFFGFILPAIVMTLPAPLVSLYLRADVNRRDAGKLMVLVWRGFLAWAVPGPVGVSIISLWARGELMLGNPYEREIKDGSTKLKSSIGDLCPGIQHTFA